MCIMLEILARDVLRRGGVLDASLLGRAVVNRLKLRGSSLPVSVADVTRACDAIVRDGVGIARATGVAFFRNAMLHVDETVLCPRADSELIIDAALKHGRRLNHDDPTIVDLGTGSGALLIAMLQECPRARGVGVDLSREAIDVARRNVVLNGIDIERVSLLESDWNSMPPSCISPCVLWNPPYVKSSQVHKGDPAIALDGGPDGLDCYRRAPLHWVARSGGIIVTEIGQGQLDCVIDLIGLPVVSVEYDLQNIARVVVFQKRD